jgi:hypothetical protein
MNLSSCDLLDILHKWTKTATECIETFEKKLLKLIFSVNSVANKTFARGLVEFTSGLSADFPGMLENLLMFTTG